MSEELHLKNKRTLSRGEVLIISVLSGLAETEIQILTNDRQVYSLNDGGMGSFEFYAEGANARIFGCVAAEGQFLDSDGVDVLASLNFDSDGRVLGVDFFKADFSGLKEYPCSGDYIYNINRYIVDFLGAFDISNVK